MDIIQLAWKEILKKNFPSEEEKNQKRDILDFSNLDENEDVME